VEVDKCVIVHAPTKKTCP